MAWRLGSVSVGVAAILAGAYCALPALAAAPACQMVQVGALPVTMRGNRPLVQGEIDGKPVRMMIDTGSAATMLWRSAAHDLGLQQKPVNGVRFYGVGGGSAAATATVHELRLDKLVIRNADLIVLGERPAFGGDAGVVGEDILSHADLEIDLAGGAIRFFEPKNCSGDQVVYWGKAYSVAPIVRSNDPLDLVVEVKLNGRAIRADLDSGSSASVVTTAAAQSVDVTPQGNGEVRVGSSTGLGGQLVETDVGVFPTFSFGDETIKNARLGIADLFHADKEVELGSHIATNAIEPPRMLLGADFLRAHRVYIARSQNRVYVTYQGGPVFEAPKRPPSGTTAPAPPSPASSGK